METESPKTKTKKTREMVQVAQQVHSKREWRVTIFDYRDIKIGEKDCDSLAQVAALFGKTRAADLSHLIYRVSSDAKRRQQMLQRWGVWFTLARKRAALPEGLKLAIQSGQSDAILQ